MSRHAVATFWAQIAVLRKRGAQFREGFEVPPIDAMGVEEDFRVMWLVCP